MRSVILRPYMIEDRFLKYIIVTKVTYWLRHYATSQKIAGLRPNDVTFFNLPNPFGSTRLWGSLSLLTEISIRNRKIVFLRSKVGPVHRADNLAAICEPAV
jgi:hypothetical protein